MAHASSESKYVCETTTTTTESTDGRGEGEPGQLGAWSRAPRLPGKPRSTARSREVTASATATAALPGPAFASRPAKGVRETCPGLCLPAPVRSFPECLLLAGTVLGTGASGNRRPPALASLSGRARGDHGERRCMKGKNWEKQRRVMEVGWVVFQKERDLSL